MGTVNKSWTRSTVAAICQRTGQEVCRLRDNKTSDCQSKSWLRGRAVCVKAMREEEAEERVKRLRVKNGGGKAAPLQRQIDQEGNWA